MVNPTNLLLDVFKKLFLHSSPACVFSHNFSNYTPCTGNFGLKTIKELKSIEEIFENKIRAVGDGACDFTAINRESNSILGTNFQV